MSTEEPHVDNTCLGRLSFWVEDTAAKMFNKFGRVVHDRRIAFLIIPTIIGLACFAGVPFLETEFNGEKLYTPQDSRSFAERDQVEAVFGFDDRIMNVWATGAGSSNILTKAALLDFMTVFEAMDGVQGTFDGQFKTLNNSCVKPTGTSCDIVSVLDFWNYDRTTLDADPDVLATLNTPLTDGLGRQVDTKDILGGVTMAGGLITEAQAFQLEVKLINNKKDFNDREDVDLATAEFEKAMSVAVRSASVPTLNVFPLSEGEFEEESGKAIDRDVAVLPIGYVLLAGFACIVLMRRNPVASYGSLGLISFATIGIAIGATFGLVSGLGVTFSTPVTVLAFLLFGLGVDDTFVIMSTFESMSLDMPVRQRIARTMAMAGVSITITTVTDFVAFVSGSASTLPAIQDFCYYACVGVVLDYVLQVTVFMAALVYAAYREKDSRFDWACCWKGDPEKKTCSQDKFDRTNRGFMQELFGEILPKYVLSTAGKIIIITISVASTALLAWAATKVEMDFNIEWFVGDDSYLQDSFDVRDTFFVGNNLPYNIYTFDGADYPNIQPTLNDMYTQFEDLPVTQACDNWYLNFVAFVQANFPGSMTGSIVNPTEFNDRLDDFLNNPSGSRFQSSLILNTDGSINATDTFCIFIPFDNMRERIDGMDKVRDVIGAFPEVDGFVYQFAFLFFDGLAVVEWETLRNIIIAAVVVLAVTIVLIANFLGAFFIFLMLVLTDIGILGTLYLAGVNFNMVSAINLVIAVGLAIDSSVHVCHAYLTSAGTRHERAVNSLRVMGKSAAVGGISTLLAVLPLSLASSYIFQVFFVCLATIVLFGVWHGYFVLPVLLSLLGPLPPPPAHDSHDQEDVTTVQFDKPEKKSGVQSVAV